MTTHTLYGFTVLALAAALASPSLGATVNTAPGFRGDSGGSMIDIGITLGASAVTVTANVNVAPDNFPTAILTPLPGGTTVAPADKSSVLNGKAYNWEYGWTLLDGTLAAGNVFKIERIAQSTPDLVAYDRYHKSGGVRTYDMILASDGSFYTFEGTGMAHNAYAISPQLSGDIWATYRVHVADSSGNLLDSAYAPADITLHWTAVPEPTALVSSIAVGGVSLLRRRKQT